MSGADPEASLNVTVSDAPIRTQRRDANHQSQLWKFTRTFTGHKALIKAFTIKGNIIKLICVNKGKHNLESTKNVKTEYHFMISLNKYKGRIKYEDAFQGESRFCLIEA